MVYGVAVLDMGKCSAPGFGGPLYYNYNKEPPKIGN